MDLQHNLMAECRWGGVQKSKILRTSYVDGPQGECAINMTFFIAPHTNSNETANSLSAGAVFIIIVGGGRRGGGERIPGHEMALIASLPVLPQS